MKKVKKTYDLGFQTCFYRMTDVSRVCLFLIWYTSISFFSRCLRIQTWFTRPCLVSFWHKIKVYNYRTILSVMISDINDVIIMQYKFTAGHISSQSHLKAYILAMLHKVIHVTFQFLTLSNRRNYIKTASKVHSKLI